NGLTGRAHRLIQADCLAWLREANEQFDLIFIDPPTFSNSKRMEDAFDVREHDRPTCTQQTFQIFHQRQMIALNIKRIF
ncbi:hypothetical protein IBK38_28005, partial [Escherichia coli]